MTSLWVFTNLLQDGIQRRKRRKRRRKWKIVKILLRSRSPYTAKKKLFCWRCTLHENLHTYGSYLASLESNFLCVLLSHQRQQLLISVQLKETWKLSDKIRHLKESTGKSGSHMYLTEDRTMFFKTIHREEARTLKTIIRDYIAVSWLDYPLIHLIHHNLRLVRYRES